MSPRPTIVFLLCNTLWLLSSEIKSAAVTFEELDWLNITCNETNVAPSYSCHERRMQWSLWEVTRTSCHCDPSCSQLGTCCLDSPFHYRNPKTGLGSCRTVQNKLMNFYFLIDKCPNSENTNDAFQTLCEDELNAEIDFMSSLPVTSLSSYLSYKNYFCFRCHESHNNYTLWNVEVRAPVEFKSRRYEEVNLTYNKDTGKWVASDGGNGTTEPVNVSIEIPKEVIDYTKMCASTLISGCSVEWPQDEIREKCSMYMFVIVVIRDSSHLVYKNPHCALCNFEEVKKYNCMFFHDYEFQFGTSKKLYSFTLLMDIGTKDGEKVGKTQRCDDAEVWDPVFKKCRKLLCNQRGYIVKGGKCSPP